MRPEEFHDMEGYEGIYRISSHGRVYSMPRISPHGHKIGGKFLRLSATKGHYPNFGASKDGVRKSIEPHRLVAKYFVPNPDNLPEVNHKDGVKTNGMVDNLEWSTHRENVRHGFRTGLTRPNRTSSFTGVYNHPGWKSTPWVAVVCVKRKAVLSKPFRTEIEAAQAYNEFVVDNGLDNPLNDLSKLTKEAA